MTAQAHFHDLGLRERTWNLPVMMAFVLSLIWRQIGSVCEAIRTRNREGLLWVDARKVWQQATEQRCRSLSADLFKGPMGLGVRAAHSTTTIPCPATTSPTRQQLTPAAA